MIFRYVSAIRKILAGDVYVSERYASRIAKLQAEGDAVRSPLEILSDRELEIFELIGRCRSISQISEQLHISPKTVDAHRGNIKTKLNLTDAASLMREAILWIELEKESAPEPESKKAKATCA